MDTFPEKYDWIPCRDQRIMGSSPTADTSPSELLNIWCNLQHQRRDEIVRARIPRDLLFNNLSWKKASQTTDEQ